MEHAAAEIASVVEQQAGYLFLIPLLPLIGAIINATLGFKLQQRFGKRAVHAVALTAVFASLGVAMYAVADIVGNDDAVILVDRLWTWIGFRMGGVALTVPLELSADRLTAVMLFVVTFVGSLIHVFSTGYMQDEKPYWRFFAWLNLFMFAMLVLVLGSSLLVMFVGWEGVGLCSYLLISYYYEETDKAAAGMKAFVVNRIGDFAFICGMGVLLWAIVGAWQDDGRFVVDAAGRMPTLVFRDLEKLLSDPAFRDAFLAKTVFGVPVATMVGVLFFIGATGKSAQLPLYVWLPDAMAGPTPVSALIHAATMVTAGVYMVARMNFLYVHSPVAMTVVATTGALTALFAATIGFFQTDIKKVLAYSTVSQLGYMFVGVGVGAYSAGVFHLMTHAFFKACLFLGAGSVIHSMHGEQDIQKMGGLAKKMPWTHATFLVATLAIAGVPLLSGFFSKDEILYKTLALSPAGAPLPWLGTLCFAMALTAAAMTALYMFRLYFLTFSGEQRDHHAHPHESPWTMTLPLVVLAFGAAIAGYIGLPIEHLNVWEHWLEPVFAPATARIVNGGSEDLEHVVMGASTVIALLGIGLAWLLYRGPWQAVPARLAASWSGVHRMLWNKYWVDEAYDTVVVKPLIAVSRWTHRWVDAGLIDGVVVNGSARSVSLLGSVLRLTSNGDVQAYAAALLVGLAVLAWVAL